MLQGVNEIITATTVDKLKCPQNSEETSLANVTGCPSSRFVILTTSSNAICKNPDALASGIQLKEVMLSYVGGTCKNASLITEVTYLQTEPGIFEVYVSKIEGNIFVVSAKEVTEVSCSTEDYKYSVATASC